jgi:hypothetical protein
MRVSPPQPDKSLVTSKEFDDRTGTRLNLDEN